MYRTLISSRYNSALNRGRNNLFVQNFLPFSTKTDRSGFFDRIFKKKPQPSVEELQQVNENKILDLLWTSKTFNLKTYRDFIKSERDAQGNTIAKKAASLMTGKNEATQELDRYLQMMDHVTPEELADPSLIKTNQVSRIANASGYPISTVKELINGYKNHEMLWKFIDKKRTDDQPRYIETKLSKSSIMRAKRRKERKGKKVDPYFEQRQREKVFRKPTDAMYDSKGPCPFRSLAELQMRHMVENRHPISRSQFISLLQKKINDGKVFTENDQRSRWSKAKEVRKESRRRLKTDESLNSESI